MITRRYSLKRLIHALMNIINMTLKTYGCHMDPYQPTWVVKCNPGDPKANMTPL